MNHKITQNESLHAVFNHSPATSPSPFVHLERVGAEQAFARTKPVAKQMATGLRRRARFAKPRRGRAKAASKYC